MIWSVKERHKATTRNGVSLGREERDVLQGRLVRCHLQTCVLLSLVWICGSSFVVVWPVFNNNFQNYYAST